MKRTTVWFGFIAIAAVAASLLTGCASSSKNTGSADVLDIAIREASDYLNTKIPKGNKVAFINISGGFPDLADYILSDLSKHGVNDSIFSVVDRASLDQVRAELNFNLSGEVSDQSAQEIGRMLGAQTIVSGSVRKIGALYRLEVKAIEVQTAAVQGQWNKNIPDGATIAALTENTNTGGSASAVTSGGTQAASVQPQPTAQAQPASQTYKVGDTGPAGGLIFYDKGNNVGGWRYMEAAPVEYEKRAIFWVPLSGRGTIDDPIVATGAVGDGLRSTQVLFEAFVEMGGGGFNTAVRYCVELEVNGFKDWFVPTLDELKWVYGNLYLKDIGGFKDDWYWAIKVWRTYNRTEPLNFKTNETDRFVSRDDRKQYYIRPIRRF